MIAFNDGGGRPRRRLPAPCPARYLWRKAMRAWAKCYRRARGPEARSVCLRLAIEARQKSLA